jgi:hypothetical protein
MHFVDMNNKRQRIWGCVAPQMLLLMCVAVIPREGGVKR